MKPEAGGREKLPGENPEKSHETNPTPERRDIRWETETSKNPYPGIQKKKRRPNSDL